MMVRQSGCSAAYTCFVIWMLQESYSNLSGNVLKVFHNYGGALSNYEKALEMQRHDYCENAKNTNLASTLGNVYHNLCDYNAACTNYEKALEMKRHVYGENAKNTN
jgi:tetratricopeptide (TPR) repeat protein